MTNYVMQKEALAQAATDLRKTLIDAKVDFIKRGYPGSADLVDYALKCLNPILDLCIAQELEEPFDFGAYMGRIMDDHLGFPHIKPVWYALCRLGRGGLTIEEFDKTDFVKLQLLPKQLRPPPEYVPSPEAQAIVKHDLKFKSGG